MHLAPLAATQTLDQFRVSVVVAGGGVTGQAGAIRQGVAQGAGSGGPGVQGGDARRRVPDP